MTGTIHILSISGLHVGILALGFWTIFRTGILPRSASLAAAMVLTILYAFLTDLHPPVVRATILVVTMCTARLMGRTALGFNTLSFAGIIVLMQNPLSLFLAGTQLSFLAVAAMIFFHPLLMAKRSYDPLDRLIARTRPLPVRLLKSARREIWRVFLTGAVIWLVSLPIVWKQYGRYCPLKPTHPDETRPTPTLARILPRHLGFGTSYPSPARRPALPRSVHRSTAYPPVPR